MTARSKLAFINYRKYVTLLKWQSSGFVEDHWCFNNKFTLDVLQFRICRF